MKAAFLTGIRQMEVRQTAAPEIREGDDVLLRVETVGVCGSDIHYYTAGRIGSAAVKYPWIIGHECACTVIETGREAVGLKAGDRVAVEPLIACGECDQCLAGRPHTCRNQKFLGCPGEAAGTLSEYLVMPGRCCFPIPERMSFEQAVLVEPLSIAMHTVRLAAAPAGAKVAILGTGPIGLCVLLALRSAAAATVYATDLLDGRLTLARGFGADWTANAGSRDIVAEISDVEPLGMDYVFECAGEQETLDQAAELLKPGGVLVIVGIPTGSRISFDMNILRRKELRLQNVRRQNCCVQTAIDAIAAGGINVDPLVTHHFPLARTREAFEMVSGYRDGVVKAVIDVADGP